MTRFVLWRLDDGQWRDIAVSTDPDFFLRFHDYEARIGIKEQYRFQVRTT